MNARMFSSDPATTQPPGSLTVGQVDVTGQVLGDRLGAQRHRDHHPTRRGVHQARPHRDHLDGRLQIEDASDGGCGVLADAVPGHCRRLDTVGLDQLRQRIFAP